MLKDIVMKNNNKNKGKRKCQIKLTDKLNKLGKEQRQNQIHQKINGDIQYSRHCKPRNNRKTANSQNHQFKPNSNIRKYK